MKKNYKGANSPNLAEHSFFCKRFKDQYMLLHAYKIKFIKNNEKCNYQAQPDADFKKKLDLYFR